MTSRERWTVYPLLLLSIGLALVGRFSNSDFSTVRCRELQVFSHDGEQLLMQLGDTGDDAGMLTLYRQRAHGAGSAPAVRFSGDEHGGKVEVLAPKGAANLVLGINEKEKLWGLIADGPRGIVRDGDAIWGVHYPVSDDMTVENSEVEPKGTQPVNEDSGELP